jgi:hypothetical protein
MKRVRRWVWRATVVISLLLFVATIVVWVRSYWTSDLVAETRFRSWQAELNCGQFDLSADLVYPIRPMLPGNPTAPIHTGPARAQEATWQFLHADAPANRVLLPKTFFGFGASKETAVWFMAGSTQPMTSDIEGTHWYVPAWSIALLTLPAPVWWMIRRRRVFGPGLCSGCGYDLRATPERCPECGKEV